jgi:hypothetical protein
LDAKALTAGKMMISPKLRIIYSEPWANSNQQKSTMQISRRGMRQDAVRVTSACHHQPGVVEDRERC